MSERIQSGICLCGPRMRYAEIAEEHSGLRLLRLGSCDFEFDVEEVLLTGSRQKLETIREAVGDVFSGSASTDFGAVMAPHSIISFFSPVSDRAPAKEKRLQLEGDTVLMTGHGSALSVVAESVSKEHDEEEGVTWYHVAALPAPVHRNLSFVLGGFPEARRHFMTSMQAAARVGLRLERRSPVAASRPAAAIVGLFGAHSEISILHSSKWVFGVVSESPQATDVAYGVLSMAARWGIDQEDLGRLYLYGDALGGYDLSALRAVAGDAVLRMNPLDLVQGGEIDRAEGFEVAEYVQCLGAAM